MVFIKSVAMLSQIPAQTWNYKRKIRLQIILAKAFCELMAKEKQVLSYNFAK